MPEQHTEAERLFQLISEQHGSNLTDEELEIVRQRVDAVVETGETLRAVPLDNADEPFVTFTPHDART